jgi:hypothetical protein
VILVEGIVIIRNKQTLLSIHHCLVSVLGYSADAPPAQVVNSVPRRIDKS